jgi:dTDP-4-amino-4,6-dideoxygalactose transaminase
MKNIPLVDLNAQYKNISAEINKSFKKIVESSQFILGEDVALFEKNFAKYADSNYTVGVDNGSSALELGMRALGIGPGDEVITPANSFIASSSSISFTGAKPVLVDCEEDYYNIDPDKIEKSISKKTKAIMFVHLYGQPVQVDKIKTIAKKYKLFLIEDACQAHGAKYKRKRVGSFGNFAAFSFYPGKNLGAYGDAGAVTTNNKLLAEKVSMMRNYGQRKKYDHVFIAWNKRMDNLQAAFLNVKLNYLDDWNNSRRKVAMFYNKHLAGLPVILPKVAPDVEHVYHLYVIRTKSRDKLLDHLHKNGIGAGIHYPIPIHLQKAYKDLGYKKGSFPVTENISREIISLPMYPEMKEADVLYIKKVVGDFFN